MTGHQQDLFADVTVDDWWADGATRAIRDYGRDHAEFTVFDALAAAGVSCPDNHKSQIGALTHRLRSSGLIVAAGFTTSHRPGSRGSAVRTWRLGRAS